MNRSCENAAIGIDKTPVIIVKLFHQLEELPIGALGVKDKIEEASQVIFPVAIALHLMNMIANPIELAHEHASVDEDLSPVGPDDLPEMPHHIAKVMVSCCKNPGIGQLPIVVGSTAIRAALQTWKRI